MVEPVSSSTPNAPYLFAPETLEQIVSEALREKSSSNNDHLLDNITRRLAAAYPNHVYTGNRRWIWNRVEGAIGEMALLHGSANEYLLFFRTVNGTNGGSGVYKADVHDIMIQGGMVCRQSDGSLEHYTPGQRATLKNGRSKDYTTTDDSYMLEYGRGDIFSMLPTGLRETITLPRVGFWSTVLTVWDFGGLILHDTFQRLEEDPSFHAIPGL
ncbi:MAG: hypothetical protein HYT77_03540 [Deltaproteobacteria bacterium]|nr:hypothetical protein [Deltaproteobacteria bacterium]